MRLSEIEKELGDIEALRALGENTLADRLVKARADKEKIDAEYPGVYFEDLPDKLEYKVIAISRTEMSASNMLWNNRLKEVELVEA